MSDLPQYPTYGDNQAEGLEAQVDLGADPAPEDKPGVQPKVKALKEGKRGKETDQDRLRRLMVEQGGGTEEDEEEEEEDEEDDEPKKGAKAKDKKSVK